MTAARVRWVLLGLAGVVLVVHSLQYGFVTDDAYISFVYSRNFAEHNELSFNLGDPVEGYTSFLWTFLLGLMMKVGLPPEGTSLVLATACSLGTLYLSVRIMDRMLGRESPWSAVPALILAASSGFACWTSGGLETQLFVLTTTGALEATIASVDHPKALRRAAVLAALGAMTRPEGILVFGVLGGTRIVHVLLDYRVTKRPIAQLVREELIAIGIFLALWGPWFLWRSWYYGYWAPNTYYVKATGKWLNPKHAAEMTDNGFYYIGVWLKQTKLRWALPLVVAGLVAIRPRTPRFVGALACGLLALVYIPYTISVGGDFMGLHRFIMPLFVAAAILIVLGVERLVMLVPERARLGAWLGPAVILGGLYVYSQVQLTKRSLDPKNLAPDRGIDTPAFLIVYTDDRGAIGKAMVDCFRPDDFSIVGGAGAQPYYGRMRAIDVFGLVSEKIAHDEPRVRPRAGHTKFASEKVLASYNPTFIFSCYQIHAKPDQPTLGCGGYWKSRGYEQVTMHVPGMTQQGEYYTFLAKKDRAFTCPGRVK